MQVILKKNVAKLGTAGDLVTVKPGYARNFLIPKDLAALASTNNLKEFEHQKRVASLIAEKERAAASSVAEKLSALSLTFARKVGEQDKLFGSVTNSDIERELNNQGFSIDRRMIEVETSIKQLGKHEFSIRLHKDVTISLSLEVVAE